MDEFSCGFCSGFRSDKARLDVDLRFPRSVVGAPFRDLQQFRALFGGQRACQFQFALDAIENLILRILLPSPKTHTRKPLARVGGGKADGRSKPRRHFPRPRHCVKSHDATFYPGPKCVADEKAETHHRPGAISRMKMSPKCRPRLQAD